MNSNFKKKIAIFGFISLFLLIAITLPAVKSSHFDDTNTISVEANNEILQSADNIQFNSIIETYDFWLNFSYDGTPQTFNFSGSYSDIYTYTSSYAGYYNSTYPDVWIEQETICNFTETSSQNMTIIMVGNISNHLILDVYRVDVSYGVNLDLIWLALRNGTQIAEQTFYNYSSYNSFEQNYTREYTYTTKLYDEYNGTLLDTIIELDTEKGNYSDTLYNPDGFSDGNNWTKMSVESQFSMPLILSMQFFKSQNNVDVAFADLIQGKYYIYNDTDDDGIYSLGENKTLISLDMYSNAEFQGYMHPYVGNIKINTTTGNETHSAPHSFFPSIPTTYMPSEVKVSDIVNNISFSNPELIGNKVSWDINYAEYPVAATVTDEPGMGMMGFMNNPKYSTFMTELVTFDQPAYDKCSPGNFSYGFDYAIEQEKADLDYTIGISKLSNESFYNACQGLGLSLPHYTYFISSETINKTADNVVTRPEDLFGFEIGGSSIAQLDMANPLKKNYTLFDYPKEGNITEHESFGGTVNQLITSAENQQGGGGMGGGDFSNMIYALEGEVESNPTFDNFTGLFTMATQNYPVWSGRKMIHDPTFTVFYKGSSDPNTGSSFGILSFLLPQDTGGINSYLVIPLFATVVITVSIIAIKSNRKKERILE
ncbi:MAG: hypothetical protein GF364_08030 [Candidatus Lokiarchaeota archaeon]|nr:hypothetical protein [Candidatus Lokiarchaeota archaeon]